MLARMFRRIRAARQGPVDPTTGRRARLVRWAVRPDGWKAPLGYENGVLVEPGGRLLFVAGQIAWDAEQRLVGEGDMARQFVQALDNMRNEIGIERIIFGSDFPGPRMWMPLREWVGAFRSLPALGEEHGVRFDDRDVDAILGGNSARILGL